MHFLAGAAVSAVLAWGSFSGEVGSGVMKEESRQVPAFHRVKVSQGVEAEVTQGGKPSVVVRGDDNLIKFVRTEVTDGTLVISLATEEVHGIHTKERLKVTVTTPSIDGAEAQSGAGLELANASGRKLDLRATSGGAVNAKGLAASTLHVEASGGGVVRLSGKAKELQLDCSGGAAVKAGELAAESVHVEGSGGASVEV
ncbi:MAG TPA: head GIN domain-containing protein, partial [Myxococcaceae bacterium]|nr:head GIN domain-containing protein [Myxococcaceae bacterium]